MLETRRTQVRVGAVQWQMREFASVEAVLQQVEYFVDALADYQSDFAVFPELFNAPLMGLQDRAAQQDQLAAIRFLAGFTERFRTELSRMAVSYNINIVAGSMIEVGEDDHLYNVAYLCHRDGTIERQAKLHITPQERRDWVVEGGDELRVFDTDAGRVGIQICYDVEFPELSRLLADQDMDILFVPFWTDTKNGYLRVRHCAQARAIENECYVVLCGSVGNVPSIENLDIQYAQSSVFSPSDFSFPHDAVLAETTPNTEMIMFSDLDLNRLKVVRNEARSPISRIGARISSTFAGATGHGNPAAAPAWRKADTVLQRLRRWRAARFEARHPFPEHDWREARARLPLLAALPDAMADRLGHRAWRFLHEKRLSLHPDLVAQHVEFDAPARLALAAQACLLTLLERTRSSRCPGRGA